MDLVHVVFASDGTVRKISACPSETDAQSWFNRLSRETRDRYESLSGGRGVFRLFPGELLSLQQKSGGVDSPGTGKEASGG
ncbi:hypothetical protein [Leptospirillum ferriphilum]|jgi:hypothetical protein|uniref:Uncharacterized protein n=1 Tax=Leptospirillum ferriphilum YSK TaxID=1441628 RepID=A0A059XQJ2_9BACT|nr:hypothetical protein [Leptospirillum ferriphilum]AIA30829.1 hypothetical protein Y981_08990 [Leptospirillum ferriphilum YSK]OOH77275.1 hypothetical protein BOX30_10110 [Leptospirillum ferriphilum]